MNKGWLELESDPGLFTLLLQDIGVKGVQVEEIYDLQKPIEGPTYGFIFLFRWIEERRSRRKTITEEETFVTDENIVNSIFFAQQVIPNSCATHALLSVLLNCEKVNLGETLSKLKAYCRNMSPETKGDAIGNIPELAKAHNSHARKEPSHLPEKQQGMTVRTMEAFHFVSYVPINGRLFELDGLKPWPIDHGPWDSNEDWTEKFRRVISERLGMATGGEPYHDIRYNLMAVVPDKVSLYEHKLSTLKTNRQIVLDAIQQMMKGTYPASTEKEKSSPNVEKHETVQQPHKYPLETSRQSIGPQSFNTSSSKGVETVMSVRSDNTRSDIKEETPMDVDFISVSSAADQRRVEIKTDNSLEIKTDILHVKEEVVVTQQAAYPDTPAESSKDTEITTQLNLNKANTETDSIKPSQNNPVVSESSDVTKPLTIETKFATSPGPSSESTDTASEVGSAFSSPGSAFDTSAQNSPNLSSGEKSSEHSPLNRSDLEGSRSKTKFSSQQGFRFKDLVALLNNVDNEIKLCETKLQDEQEKIRKYKIDDCRRTHNYDPFLCTFLSMLAEQGLLAELIQQHSLIKKRVPGRIGKLAKLTQAKKRTKAKRRR